GKCHVGYIPKGKIIGLSKVARVVDIFARRLQVQENLTKQIAETIMQSTGARGVGVVIEAKHLCMMMRGVEKQNSTMITSCMLGVFKVEARPRWEFLSLLRDKRKTAFQAVQAVRHPCLSSQWCGWLEARRS